MLDNENAKGKSDLVFTRNETSKLIALSKHLLNLIYFQMQSYQLMTSISSKCLEEEHSEKYLIEI